MGLQGMPGNNGSAIVQICYSSIAIIMGYTGINVDILTVFSNVDIL